MKNVHLPEKFIQKKRLKKGLNCSNFFRSHTMPDFIFMFLVATRNKIVSTNIWLNVYFLFSFSITTQMRPFFVFNAIKFDVSNSFKAYWF